MSTTRRTQKRHGTNNVRRNVFHGNGSRVAYGSVHLRLSSKGGGTRKGGRRTSEKSNESKDGSKRLHGGQSRKRSESNGAATHIMPHDSQELRRFIVAAPNHVSRNDNCEQADD